MRYSEMAVFNMVDTVKLRFSEEQFVIKDGYNFGPSKSERGIHRPVRNPSPSELRAGLYLPRLTLVRHPVRANGIVTELIVEFSAPKLLFGNNFAELADGDFEAVVEKLEQCLDYMGVTIARPHILGAKVTGW